MNAGSGTDTKPNYINFDIRPDVPEVDIVDDIRHIEDYFEPNTITNIICFQVLEHFKREEWRSILSRLCALVKPGGRVHLRVPSVEDLVDAYHRKHISAEDMFWVIYGRQEELKGAPAYADYHKSGFTIETLKTEFEKNGFFVEEINHVFGLGLYHVVAIKK